MGFLGDMLNGGRRRTLGIDISRQIEVINRTSRRLTATVDGRTFTLEPGKNMLPSVAVVYAIRQNPRWGTFDESGLTGESLIAVPGFTPEAECGMIEPTKEHKGKERFDRDANPLAGPHQTITLPKRARPDEQLDLSQEKSAIEVANDSAETFRLPPTQ